MAKTKAVSEIEETVETVIEEPTLEPTTVGNEEYSIIETKCTKAQLEEDGWVQETKEPFVDVDGKSKLLFHKKSFYKYLEVNE